MPSAADEAWKCPPRGHPERDPDKLLGLEAEFQESTKFTDWKPWRVLALLQQLLGDHRVTLITPASAKELYQTGYPWRAAPNSKTLHGLLSWFTREETWSALKILQTELWCLEAYRGGGKSRHRVWKLD